MSTTAGADDAVGFPTSAAEVTPSWLTGVLRGRGIDAPVAAVGWTPLGVGSGFMGAVARLSIEWEREPGPFASLVMKSAAPSPKLREIIRGYRNYEREVGFYRELAPLLEPVVPACHHAEHHVPTNHCVLLLEDFGPDYRDGDQVAGCTVAEARRCIDVMIDLHAAYWDAAARPELDWVPRVDGEWFTTAMAAGVVAGWPGIVERFGELVPAGLRELGDGFATHLPRLTARLGRCPQTLVHSDFRLDNVMFARQPDAAPVKVLDWQGILVSAGVHDVAFLLSQNLDDSVRAAHERELVEYYHRGLVERGIVDYPPEQVWEDYRLAVLVEWLYVVIIAGTLTMADDRSRALFAAMVRRAGAAIEDLDALRLLPR